MLAKVPVREYLYILTNKSLKTGFDWFPIFITLHDSGSVPVSPEVVGYTSRWFCICSIFTVV